MTRIHSSFNSAEIHSLCGALESHGIRCEVRGEFRGTLAGGIPLADAMVELWVAKDQKDRALEILAGSASEESGPWNCGGCGESVGSQFSQCWKCGKDRVQREAP